MRIFLTGGAGFIGGQVLRRLLAESWQVRALRQPGTAPRVLLPREPEWIEGTLADVRPEMFKGCGALVHLAAAGVNPAEAGWDACFATNVTASLHAWRAAAAAGVRRFIVCGSCFEYGLAAGRYAFIPADAPLVPTGAYHASKAAATVTAIGCSIDWKLEMAVLRPFHVFGEGEALSRFWPALRRAAAAGEDFPMTSGQQVRDFMPVEDLAAQFVETLTDPLVPGKPVIRNLGTGRPQTLLEFARHWWSRWGARGKLLPGAMPYRANEVMRYVPDLKPFTFHDHGAA